LSSLPRVLPATFGRRRAVFQRWYGSGGHLRAALDVYYRVRLRYADLHEVAVEPDRVTSIQIRSSIGEQFRPTTRLLWLRGMRVVPLNGGLESKPIYYTIERAVVGGSNVVNESQQKFFPASQPDVTVQLLFYRARFHTRDAFFGFAVGHRIRLTFPQGTTRHYRLDGDGTVVIPSLPRGNYRVEVEGGGISLGGPVALSRNQDVKVGVISYLDLAVVTALAALFAIGLPLMSRPRRRARMRRRIESRESIEPGNAAAALPVAARARLSQIGVRTAEAWQARLAGLRRSAPITKVRAAVAGRVESKDVTTSSIPGAERPVAGKQRPASLAAAEPASSSNGLVPLNTATLAQLDTLPGIGPATARGILAYRQAHGAFRSLDELAAIPGIGPVRLKQLRGRVAL
jgi:competence ComEA-like helix-hairpin-helix protein